MKSLSRASNEVKRIARNEVAAIHSAVQHELKVPYDDKYFLTRAEFDRFQRCIKVVAKLDRLSGTRRGKIQSRISKMLDGIRLGPAIVEIITSDHPEQTMRGYEKRAAAVAKKGRSIIASVLLGRRV